MSDELKARPYQVLLVEQALRQNVIIYLPTGAGKTFIALQVLKMMSHDLEKSYADGGKLSVFLVNVTVLAQQQADYLRRYMPFKVGAYTGDLNVDYWTVNQWHDEFCKNQILVMTAQIFLDIINHGQLSLERVNVIVFDECHRAVGDHAMRQVMKTFEKVPPASQPRVIGLSATLLNGNCPTKKVLDTVKELEITFNACVATSNIYNEVIQFSSAPKQHVLPFKVHTPCQASMAAISKLKNLAADLQQMEKIRSNAAKALLKRQYVGKLPNESSKPKNFSRYIADAIEHIESLGAYAGRKAVLSRLIQVESVEANAEDTWTQLMAQVARTQFSVALRLLEDGMSEVEEGARVLQFSSPKVHHLLGVLRHFHEYYSSRAGVDGDQDGDIKALIFTERRYTARVLYYILSDLACLEPSFAFLKPDFIVGANAYLSDSLYRRKENGKTRLKFCNGQVNILVASNVLEEGVDFPACNLVVDFDYVSTYRSYVQSKGRARHKDGHFFVMVPATEKLKQKLISSIQTFSEIETILQKFLTNSDADNRSPTKEDLKKMYDEEDVPPYYASPDVHVTMTSSISLLNRYCQALPQNRYSNVEPLYFKEGGIYYVELPTACPVRQPIPGIRSTSLLFGKRSAALKACELLHKAGELTDKLLPRSRDTLPENADILFKHWPDENSDGPKPGSSKFRRCYNITKSKFLMRDKQAPNVFYIHVLRLLPLFPNDDEASVALKENLVAEPTLAFLTPHPLPHVCQFPLYFSQGEIATSIDVNQGTINLEGDELVAVRRFNVFLYAEVLKVLKSFVVCDVEELGETLLVVPVRQSGQQVQVDFKIMRQHLALMKIQKLDDEERLQINVYHEAFVGKIVMPWYRVEETEYLVTSITYSKTANSIFPRPEAGTFAQYFSKYNVSVLSPDQPLLTVKMLSRRLNCLRPRSVIKRRNRTEEEEDLIELIAELCVKQDFPAALWIKCKALPSALHRLLGLLRAEELRQTIAAGIAVGKAGSCSAASAEPLTEDKYLEHNSEQEELLEDELELLLSPSKATKQLENVSDVKGTIAELSEKMLERNFPWFEEDEPVDVHKHIEVVSLFEIQNYINFKLKVEADSETTSDKPKKSRNFNIPALTYNPEFCHRNIALLTANNPAGPHLGIVYSCLVARSGQDIVDLERLETLGDSFLKIAVSMYLFDRFPLQHEGDLTTLKSRIIGNRNLLYCGLAKGLGGSMKTGEFSPSSEWLPPGFLLPAGLQEHFRHDCSRLFDVKLQREDVVEGRLPPGLLGEPTGNTAGCQNMLFLVGEQYLSDKDIADCVEALLGAYLQANGPSGAAKLLGWFGIVPTSEQPEFIFTLLSRDPVFGKRGDIAFHIGQGYKVQEVLGYKFRNKGYLLQALTHSSYIQNRVTPTYEKLEFIGDAVLDFLLTCYIFENCGNLPPGDITDLRSALVNNVTFASLAVRCGFHKYLLHMSNKLMGAMNNFVVYQEERDHLINDEVVILIEEDEIKMSEFVEVPKVLGDIFEAIIGAVFLDSGKDFEETWKVVYRIMWKEIKEFSQNVPKNPVRLLLETKDAHAKFHEPVRQGDTVVQKVEFLQRGIKKPVYGFGESKTQARRAAAKLALKLLRGNK